LNESMPLSTVGLAVHNMRFHFKGETAFYTKHSLQHFCLCLDERKSTFFISNKKFSLMKF